MRRRRGLELWLDRDADLDRERGAASRAGACKRMTVSETVKRKHWFNSLASGGLCTGGWHVSELRCVAKKLSAEAAPKAGAARVGPAPQSRSRELVPRAA